MTGIANHAKRSEHEQFGDSVRLVSNLICGLIEAAAQAAYLVAVSDRTSVAGRPGLVDQAQFARAAQHIQQACNSLTNPASNQHQVSAPYERGIGNAYTAVRRRLPILTALPLYRFYKLRP